MKKGNALKNLFNKIKSIFLNGLLTLLPISLTYFLFKSTFCLIKGWLAPIESIEALRRFNIPHIEFILVFAFIFAFGLVLKLFILKKLLKLFEESIILRLPLVRPIYTGIKQLAHGLTTQDQHSLNKVVIIEFPSEGIYSLGFLTGQFPEELTPYADKEIFNIYIPTTPNPTTGFFIIAPKSKFKPIDLSRQEAMAIIISGGIIKPKTSANNTSNSKDFF